MLGLVPSIQGGYSVACPWTLGTRPRVTIGSLLHPWTRLCPPWHKRVMSLPAPSLAPESPAYRVLKDVFGYASFRPGQEEVIASILAGALVTGVAAALLMLLLARRSRLKTDAALGIALGTFFAAGVVLLSYVQGRAGAGQAGLETFLFGQAAAVLRSDLTLMAGIATASLLLVLALWKEFAVTTFDPAFAASLGLPVAWLEALMTAMVALAVVLGLQMVGVVLMSAMVVAPAVAARQWTDRLGPMVVLASAFGAIGGLAGALISAVARGLATGPLIVLALTAIAAVSLAFAPQRGLIAALTRRRRDHRALGDRRVLTAMAALARHHDDPGYLAEQGMLDAYLGTSSRARLERLRRRGAVRRTSHRPGEGAHWTLTEEGRREAARSPEDRSRS